MEVLTILEIGKLKGWNFLCSYSLVERLIVMNLHMLPNRKFGDAILHLYIIITKFINISPCLSSLGRDHHLAPEDREIVGTM